MGWLRFLRRRRWDEERAREIESYVEIETDENIGRGLPPDLAQQAARRKFGNPTLIREEIYRMNSVGWIEAVWQDLRHGARLLRLSPGFAAVAILSLALGIGANAAIFQLLDALRLRSLPVKDPKQLAEVKIVDREHATGNFTSRYNSLTYPQWLEIRKRAQGFSDISAWSTGTFNLASGGQARYAQGLWVSGEFFHVLGVSPVLGRLLTESDDRPGCGAGAAVISYPFWQREFGGDPSVIGRTLHVDGHPLQIAGVTPAGFFGVEVGRVFDVALPMCAEAVRGENSRLEKRNAWWLSVIGRRKADWPLARASAQLSSVSPGIFAATLPPTFTADEAKYYLAYKLGAVPAGTGSSYLRQTYSTPLWLLLATAGLVLLIACANLANLMLARASVREREIAVRLALGASQGRLIRQLLAESILLSGMGAGAGVLLAHVLSRFLVSFLTTKGSPLFLALDTDWRVLGFTAALATLTCLLFGLAPAIRASRTEPGAVMKAGGRGLTASRERFGIRRVLVASQMALSLVLLVSALLFAASLRNLLELDAGFRQNGILIANVGFGRMHLPADRRVAFQQEVLETVRAIPGVDSAAGAFIVPISGAGWNQHILRGGKKKGISWLNRITPGYFKTLGTPLLEGRDFDRQDTANSQKVVIVNQLFARKYLNTDNPIGETFQLEMGRGEASPAYQVVGVVKNSTYSELREKPSAIAYFPMAQDPEPGEGGPFLLHSRRPLGSVLTAVKRSMAAISPEIDLNFQVLKTEIQDSLLRERLMATLGGFFGFLAVVLATVGLYGVISYMVAQRRNEIGVRMALGANGRDVVGLVLRNAAGVLSFGLLGGIALALGAARAAGSLLFGLRPYDPEIMAVAVGSLALVALAASYVPARRAARLDPMAALREE